MGKSNPLEIEILELWSQSVMSLQTAVKNSFYIGNVICYGIGCVFTMFLEGTFFRTWWHMLYKDHPEQQEIAGSR